MSNSQFNELYLTVLAVTLVFTLIIAIITYFVMALALSRLFAKVGIEPWIAWVPVFAYWRWLELGGQKGWISLLVLVPYAGIVTSIFLYIGMWRTGIAFGKESGFLVLGIFLPFVWAFLLSRQTETYRPELITAAGYPPPLAGHGSGAAA